MLDHPDTLLNSKPLAIYRIPDRITDNGKIASNSYIMAKGKACWIIDPNNSGEIVKILSEHSYRPEAILLTHCHEDHVSAVNVLRKKYNGLELWYDKKEFDQRFYRLECFEDDSELPPADRWLRDNDEVRLGDLEFRVWEVGGHSPGSICLYHEGSVFYKEKWHDALLLSGDFVYKAAIGKLDAIGSDEIRGHDSLASRLWRNTTLPEATLILGGHFGPTTFKEFRAFWEKWVTSKFQATLEKTEKRVIIQKNE